MADDIPLVAKATGHRIGQEHPAVFTSFNYSSCLRDKVFFPFLAMIIFNLGKLWNTFSQSHV